VRTSLVASLALAAALCGAPAVRAGEDWKKDKAYAALLAAEAKELRDLLRSALKEDYRRQAWYLADRLLAVEPANAEAQAALEKWTDAQLQEGQVPKPAWLDKRTKRLQELGDQYARFAETLQAAGVPAVDYYPLNVRSHAYGTVYGPASASLEEAGYAWLETFGDWESKPLKETLGPLWDQVEFPPEFDDQHLELRVRWPAAKSARIPAWNFVTDAKAPEAMRMLATLDALERHLVQELGSEMKKPPERPDLLLFTEPKDYDRVGTAIIHESERADFTDTSWFATSHRSHRLILALWRHRTNAWIGEDGVLLGAAGPVLAQRHLGPGTSSRVIGRGSWVLDGVAGACQGFVRGGKGAKDAIDPGRCWLLAAARVLRDEKALVPWDELLEMDRAKVDAMPKRAVKVAFAGGNHEAKDVVVAHAQATALVVGIWKAEGGKGGKRLARLLHDLFLRDSFSDLDKTLGWKKGRAFEEAEKAMDAAHGK
jgi:hypothetical protein